MTRMHHPLIRSVCAAAAVASLMAGLAGCAPLVVSGVVAGAFMATDRRTGGAQIDDQAIELKAASRLRSALGGRGHVNVTSYNRTVLLTGEVANEADKASAEQQVRGLDNVRGVVNELAVTEVSSLSARSNDVLISTRVKAALVDAKDMHAQAIKAVTERGVVHLLGRVTEREAARAAEIARAVAGVQKVVRVFEVLTEAELAALSSGQGPAAPAPSK